jgi:methyltransferase (TIGR00027 family)
MQAGKVSKTAQVAAALRAIHHLYDVPIIFEDAFALQFTSPIGRRIVLTKPLRWFLTEVLLRSQRTVAAQVIARSKYAEDVLDELVTTGTRQYVIVGAGFDSFALRRRDLESSLRVFELDHPSTQRSKIERIHTFDSDPPANVEYVQIDFEQATVGEVLSQSGYEAGQPAFFSWLGTTMYLSKAATLDTLGAIARISAPGSEIVFDYLIPDKLLTPADKLVVQNMKRFTARRGEPMIGDFEPTELEEVLRSIGLELIENVSGVEQEKRYFSGRDDGFKPLAASFFARARVAKGAA